MNKQLIARRFTRAIDSYPRQSDVQQYIARRMIELLQKQLMDSSISLQRVIEFGCGTGHYSRLLYHTFRPCQFLLNDLCSQMQTCCTDLLSLGATFCAGDAENLPLPEDTQLITSCSTIQWFDAPERFFLRCSHSLSPDGLLAFTTFGKENMTEIRQLTNRSLTYYSLNELTDMLAPHYDILCAEEALLKRQFSNPQQVLRHLKETGVTGIENQSDGNPTLRTRRELTHFCDEYIRQFSDGTSVTLTYHPIYIIAKKKSHVPER